MTDEALDILLRHDRWATERLLIACRPLTDAQLDQPFSIGFGTLRGTLTHVVDVIGFWTSAVTHTDRADRLPPTTTIAELESLLNAKYDAFEALLANTPDGTRWLTETPTRTLEAPAVVVATHVITHSMHHRAQALNILRQLGVSPLPESSVTEWSRVAGVAVMTTKS